MRWRREQVLAIFKVANLQGGNQKVAIKIKSGQSSRWRTHPRRRSPTPATPQAGQSVQDAWWSWWVVWTNNAGFFPYLFAAVLLFFIAASSFHHWMLQQLSKCRHLQNTNRTINLGSWGLPIVCGRKRSGECSSYLLLFFNSHQHSNTTFPEQMRKSKMMWRTSKHTLIACFNRRPLKRELRIFQSFVRPARGNNRMVWETDSFIHKIAPISASVKNLNSKNQGLALQSGSTFSKATLKHEEYPYPILPLPIPLP